MRLEQRNEIRCQKHRGADLFEGHDIGILDRLLLPGHDAENITALIFLEQHELPFMAICDRLRPASNEKKCCYGMVALPDDRRSDRIAPIAGPARNRTRDFLGANEHALQASMKVR